MLNKDCKHSTLVFFRANKIKGHYSTWIKRLIDKYSLIQGKDYFPLEELSTGGRPPTIYYFTDKAFDIVKLHYELKPMIGKDNRKETIFFERLQEILMNVSSFWLLCSDVYYQYRVGKYKIDAYYESVKIAIEYDEPHHNGEKERVLDKEREDYIKSKLGCTIIRVDSTQESKGIAAIIDLFIERT